MPKKKRTPPLPFDVDAFLGSAKVQAMKGSEIGCYVMLLLLDWKEHGFVWAPESDAISHAKDRRRLAQFCHQPSEKFARYWKESLGSCFEERDGRYHNARIDLERVRLAEWSAKSAKGGKKTAQAKVNQHPNHSTATVDPKRTPARSRVVQRSVFDPSPETPVAGTNWLTPYYEAYRQYVGEEKPARIAAAVAAAREAVGDEDALYAFTAWCRDPKRGWGINSFGSRWRDYENFAVADADGNLTPRGAAYIKASGL